MGDNDKAARIREIESDVWDAEAIDRVCQALAAIQREREQLQARVAGMEVAIRFALSQNPVCSAGWIKVLNDALSPPAAPVQAEGEK